MAPNSYGGRENLEAVKFLKDVNTADVRRRPFNHDDRRGIHGVAMVTKPPHTGGLELFKWNMGWMNDMLRYVSKRSAFRKDNHDCLTFSFFYAFSKTLFFPSRTMRWCTENAP